MKHCKVELAKVKEILNLLDNEQLSKPELRNQLLELLARLSAEEQLGGSTWNFVKTELISKYFFAKFFYIYLFKKIVELVERFLRNRP